VTRAFLQPPLAASATGAALDGRHCGKANAAPPTARRSRAHLFGLMPPSISHEGYSDKAGLFSHWDNFWALRGYKDAVLMAQGAGGGTRSGLGSGLPWRDEFEQ
jgi:hypothetical protein